jgi:hypothetical protein
MKPAVDLVEVEINDEYFTLKHHRCRRNSWWNFYHHDLSIGIYLTNVNKLISLRQPPNFFR